MKKAISLLLAAVLLLSGCNMQMTMLPQNTKPTSSTKPTEETQPTENTIKPTQGSNRPNGSDIFQESNHVSNGVYATCGNYDYTEYVSSSGTISFDLICTNPLPDSATVRINTSANYTVKIHEKTPEKLSSGQYPPYLYYMLEKGVDIGRYYYLQVAAWEAKKDYNAGKINMEELQRINAESTSFQTTYLPITVFSDYLEANPTPPYYHYSVNIRVMCENKAVTVTEAELLAGDMSCVFPIGEIRIVPDNGMKKIYSATGISRLSGSDYNTELGNSKQSLKAGDASVNKPWSGGSATRQIDFKAVEDLILTNTYFYPDSSSTLEITEVEVLVIGQNGPLKMQWEPGTPLMIRKGETVCVNVLYSSPYFQQAECSVQGEIVLEYETGGKTEQFMTTASFVRGRPSMEIYLWAFQGADTKRYYVEYELPWRKYCAENGLLTA